MPLRRGPAPTSRALLPAPDAPSRQGALHRETRRARREQAPRHAHSGARPVHPRGVLGLIPRRRHDDDRRARGEGPHERSVPAVGDDDVGVRHRLRVGDPLHQPRVGRHPRGRLGPPPVPRRQHPHRPVLESASVARRRRWDGSCAVEGATTTSGSPPGGSSTSAAGGSHPSGPTTCSEGRHARGYSSWGNVPTSVSSRDRPPNRCETGGSPSRRRISFLSPRPRRSPRSTGLSSARHTPRPAGVRGSRAPRE